MGFLDKAAHAVFAPMPFADALRMSLFYGLALLACLRFACWRFKGVLILCNAGCSRRLSWVGTTARSR